MGGSRIPESQYRAACEVASRIYRQEQKLAEGVSELVSGGVNETSALDYIQAYRYLMEGRQIQRSMGADAMRVFMQDIADRYGQEGLSVAVPTLRNHLKYQPNGLMTAVLLEFEALARKPPATIAEAESLFSAKVERSLNDTEAARATRLAAADPVPATMVVQTTVFVRNADVVAAALVRASGLCERCKQPAPFLRRKDGTPYLEAHHLMTLADGGKDTLDNALALCPNCHRQVHHG
ncbi:MAG TPA: HNH endonuclease signature motif containing protein [Ramlibacter sp.]|nr:HNH endonuclease signature motif containing protein [Ramlibacter sp.]